ncbi:sensor histidine kinase [uncultured Jatrophihabitans sp.]|uniref:sensor histidine kinase n=1 Tax=uncultured Jatrophihabitans sp. TaxID=1610747 RepID=UPI0035C9CE8A
MNRTRRGRSTLAARIALLSVGIAVVTALIAGAIATGLIRNAGADSARKTLGNLAGVAQSVAMQRGTTPGRQGRPVLARLQIALRGLHVQSGVVHDDGRINASNPLVGQAVTPADVSAVLAGQSVSASRSVGSSTVFVEARPTPTGGVVVVQRRTDAVAQDERAVRQLLLALLIAAAAAVVIGLLVAWRLARPLRRTAAAAHSVAAGNRDVTLPAVGPAEVVEVSEAVNSIAGALRHSEARQREFLLSVSHDLRTPLTAIAGYAESMAEGLVPAEDTARVGGVVLGEAQRLERLVGDLLDLARLGAEDFRVELAVVDVAALAQDAAQVWQSRSAAGGVEFRLERPPGPLLAHTDPSRLRQVLDGLFDNALRVTPAGAPVVLGVRAEPAFGAVVAEVRDGGPGLTDEDLGVAFTQGVLHQRYRGVRQVGTGLGLAIVHGLVTRLGGRIEAGHAAEGGARFTVLLPPATPA